MNEQEKRHAYDEGIREVERACFSLLVLLLSGSMGPSATTVCSKLACMLANKWTGLVVVVCFGYVSGCVFLC